MKWVELLIKKGLSLREISSRLKDHGITVSYQSVRRHKQHTNLSSKIERLRRKVERWKKRKPTDREILKEKKQQRNQLRNWIDAEQDPSKEALDAYAKLEKEIITWEKIVEIKKMSKRLLR